MIRKFTNRTFFVLVGFFVWGLIDDMSVMATFTFLGFVLLSPWFFLVWGFQFAGWLDDNF